MTGLKWRTWGIRLVAVVLASFLWLHAVTEHVYSRHTTASVVVHDPVGGAGEPGGVMVASSVPERVEILVTGRGKDLLRLDEESFALHLRPEGEPGSRRSYRLRTDMVQARDESKVVVEAILDPMEVDIELDERGKRSVPVKPRLGLAVAEPYTLVGDPSIEPPRVELAGPQSRLATISFVATETLSLAKAEQDVDLYLPLMAPQGLGWRLTPSRVRVQADVQLLAQDELEVPVEVRHGEGGQFAAEPARVRVKVKGGIDVLAKIDPAQTIGLYVDALDYHGGRLRIRFEEPELFEIVEIAPAEIFLRER